MSEKATEFFRKERLALEQEVKRVKEQNKELRMELYAEASNSERSYNRVKELEQELARVRGKKETLETIVVELHRYVPKGKFPALDARVERITNNK